MLKVYGREKQRPNKQFGGISIRYFLSHNPFCTAFVSVVSAFVCFLFLFCRVMENQVFQWICGVENVYRVAHKYFLLDVQPHGSIANELYSDILKSSSVDLDRRSTTIQANNNFHGMKFKFRICNYFVCI